MSTSRKSAAACPNARKRFSEAVKQVRTDRDVSRVGLALSAGISRNTLHQIEKGAANVQLDTVARIAQALEVDAADLFLDNVHVKQIVGATHSHLRKRTADNILNVRNERELTQAQLEAEAHLPKGYIGHLERTAPDVSLEVLERIAFGLKTTVRRLLS
jgi:transcriptional regulator with XRE-family HTH domain